MAQGLGYTETLISDRIFKGHFPGAGKGPVMNTSPFLEGVEFEELSLLN